MNQREKRLQHTIEDFSKVMLLFELMEGSEVNWSVTERDVKLFKAVAHYLVKYQMLCKRIKEVK